MLNMFLTNYDIYMRVLILTNSSEVMDKVMDNYDGL